MLKVIKFIVLLPLKIAALPIIVALIAATWIAVFFISMSAWFCNLLAKYADEMDFDSLPDPDVYLLTRDTYELYKKYVDEMKKYHYSHIEIEFVI